MFKAPEKARIAIYCLNTRNGSFKDLAVAAKKAVFDARMLSEKTGERHQAIILPKENVLRYVFSITEKQANCEAEKLIPLLCSGAPSWLFFNVNITVGGMPSSQGYLIGGEKYVSQPKRNLAYGDSEKISDYCDSRIPKYTYWVYEKEWKRRGKELTSGKVPFLSFEAGNGQNFECRVCSDVRQGPKAHSISTISLVAANELPSSDVIGLACLRKGLISNDDGYGLRIVPSHFDSSVKRTDSLFFRRLLLD